MFFGLRKAGLGSILSRMEWSRGNRNVAAGLLLVVLCWCAFGGALSCGFVHFDDDQYVFENPAITQGLTVEGVRWAFTTGYVSNWHPLTWLSHMTDIEFFGLDAKAHHAVNLWIHALNAVLLFWVLRRLTGRFWLAWWVAAFWCVHPLRAESVVWISERKDVLAMLFGLLALWAYGGGVPARRQESRPTGGSTRATPGANGNPRMGWVAVFFALSLMAKPMWVTLPFVLLLLDYWPLSRWKTGAVLSLWREKWPLFVLALASCVITYIVQERGGAMGPMDAYPLFTRLVNAIVAYAEYVRLLFWPSGLAVLYPYPAVGYSGIRIAGSLALILGLSVAAVGNIRRWPWAAVGWLWFLGTLVPMIGLVQVGRQSWADRYTYLPHIGLLIALVWAAGVAMDRWAGTPRRGIRHGKKTDASARRPYLKSILAALACVLVLGLTALSRRQTTVWRNNETLFLNAVAVTENNLLAHGNLGTWYGMQGQWEQAEFHLKKVLRHRPMDGGARHSLGNVNLRQGLKKEALAEYRIAAQDPKQWEAMNNVAWLLAMAPDGAEHAGEALDWAERAVRAAPESGKATVWNTLAVARANAGDYTGAIEAAEKALELARASGDVALAERVRSRMALFREGRPYRE